MRVVKRHCVVSGAECASAKYVDTFRLEFIELDRLNLKRKVQLRS